MYTVNTWSVQTVSRKDKTRWAIYKSNNHKMNKCIQRGITRAKNPEINHEQTIERNETLFIDTSAGPHQPNKKKAQDNINVYRVKKEQCHHLI